MSNINITARPLNLKLKYPFGISRGSSDIAKNVLVKVEFDGIIAFGEAAPTAFYGEDQKSVIDFINRFLKYRPMDQYLTNIQKLKQDLDLFNLSFAQQLRSNLFSSSARAAIEIAFWDLIGKVHKKPMYELIYPANPFFKENGKFKLHPTSYTIGIDNISVIEEKTDDALNKGFNILKIKLGKSFEEDLAILKAVTKRASDYSYRLRVDANGAWDLERTKKMLDVLPEYKVELLEQPLPKGEYSKLSKIISGSPIPIICDEDCMNLSDVERLAGNVHGINIKLMKTGSIFDVIEMINLAKSYNLKVMLGCMIESSCSISAAVHISPLVDYVDLDGHLLIENDPFYGLYLEENIVLPSSNDGLGISLAGNDYLI